MVAVSLLFLVTAGYSLEAKSSTLENKVSAMLKDIAKIDGNRGITLLELETQLGKHERTTRENLLGESDPDEFIWNIDEHSYIQVSPGLGRVEMIRLFEGDKKWILVWK